MAWLQAYLSKDANLLCDTGSERVDLTPRGLNTGWDMLVPTNTPPTMAPLTQNAVRRVAQPADWGIGVSGLYYGEEIRKVDAAKQSGNLLVLGVQASQDFDDDDAEYYGLGGYSVFSGFTRNVSDAFVVLDGLTFTQHLPMVYLLDWVNSVTWAPDNPPATSAEDNSEESLTWDWANGPPVVFYDIASITIGSSPVLKVALLDGSDRFQADIPTARSRLGLIDFSTLDPANAHTGSDTAWPTSGTMEMHIRAANLSAISIRFGAGVSLAQD